MTTNDKYNLLTNGNSKILNITPVAHIPTPTDKDYTRGYINRFFVQKTNDSNSPIYEVDVNEYRKIHSSVLYDTTTLRWRISGPINPEKIGAGEIVDNGVKESNKVSIRLASDLIHKLSLYLPNLKQFHQ